MPASSTSASTLLRQWSSCFGVGSSPLNDDDLTVDLPGASSPPPAASAHGQQRAEEVKAVTELLQPSDCWVQPATLSPDSYHFMTGSDNECREFLCSLPAAPAANNAPPMADLLTWQVSSMSQLDSQCMSCPIPSDRHSGGLHAPRSTVLRTQSTSRNSMPAHATHSMGYMHGQCYSRSATARLSHPRSGYTNTELLLMIKEGGMLSESSIPSSIALESGRLSAASGAHATGYDVRDSAFRSSCGRTSTGSAALLAQRALAAERLTRAISGLCSAHSMASATSKPGVLKRTGSGQHRSTSELALAAHSVTNLTRHLMAPSISTLHPSS